MIINRVKKSFTLLELIIVVLLISITYYLTFTNSNFSIKNENTKILLKDLNKYLLTNFDFEDRLEFICIENEYKCYVRVDGEIQNNLEIKNLFKEKPEVYEFKKESNLIDYGVIDINNTSENIIFIYSINNDYKSKDLILDTLDNKVYLFNSIFTQAEIFSSLDDVFDTFNLNQIEVQDAF